MQRSYIALMLLTAFLAGCAHVTRIDAVSYLRNPSLYTNQNIIITAELPQVLDNYELFKGNTVEISARIAHFEERDSISWHLILEKDSRTLRAYEDSFVKFVPADAVYLARWAKNEGGNITARGKLLEGRMELDRLVYKHFVVDTSTIPT